MVSRAESSGYGAGEAAVLGAGLRGLRLRAGLRLVELAHLMGREPGFYAYLSRLERGRLGPPTLRLVADYLRACGASFGELVPVLDRYTSRPPVRETRARETALAGLAGDESREAARLNVYDLKTEAARKRAGQKPVAPARRAQALARQLAARHRYRAVDRAVTEELARSGSELSYVAQKLALSYGRMVWKAMEMADEGRAGEGRGRRERVRTEGGRKAEAERIADCKLQSADGKLRKGRRGRRRKTRDERLAEVEARMRERAGDVVPLATLRQVAARVARLYEEARRDRPL
ncbi:MAG: helix-turn-helix transcriptional regulator [bacterium]